MIKIEKNILINSESFKVFTSISQVRLLLLFRGREHIDIKEMDTIIFSDRNYKKWILTKVAGV